MEEIGSGTRGARLFRATQVMRRILKAMGEPVKETEDRIGLFFWRGSGRATGRQLSSKDTVAFVL